MDQIGDNKVILFIGKRNSGKSILVVDYLYYNQDMPFCTCILPTEEFNFTFTPHIPSRFIFDTYTPELLQDFLKRQKMLTKKKKMAERGIGNPEFKDVDPRGILIMDDCQAYSSEWKNDKTIKWIFMNGRHINITLVLTMQYQMGITPELRVNIDYVFILKETKRKELEKLHVNYAGMFDTLDMFRQVLREITKKRGCMVIDTTTDSAELVDQIYYYKAALHAPHPKAPPGEPFRICYDKFWENNEDYMNDNNDDVIVNEPQSHELNEPQFHDDYQRYLSNQTKTRFNVNIQRQDDNRWG